MYQSGVVRTCWCWRGAILAVVVYDLGWYWRVREVGLEYTLALPCASTGVVLPIFGSFSVA